MYHNFKPILKWHFFFRIGNEYFESKSEYRTNLQLSYNLHIEVAFLHIYICQLLEKMLTRDNKSQVK